MTVVTARGGLSEDGRSERALSRGAGCPTLAATLTLEAFGAFRGGRALADPLDLRLLPGTVLGVVGPNGVGKSSLLAALAHAGVHSFGRVRYGGREVTAMSARERATVIALLAQDLHAPDELLVRELVAVGCPRLATWAADARRRNCTR